MIHGDTLQMPHLSNTRRSIPRSSDLSLHRDIIQTYNSDLQVVGFFVGSIVVDLYHVRKLVKKMFVLL